jgi:hypothetical protein
MQLLWRAERMLTNVRAVGVPHLERQLRENQRIVDRVHSQVAFHVVKADARKNEHMKTGWAVVKDKTDITLQPGSSIQACHTIKVEMGESQETSKCCPRKVWGEPLEVEVSDISKDMMGGGQIAVGEK